MKTIRSLIVMMVLLVGLIMIPPVSSLPLETPSSLTPEEALNLLIKDRHTENLPSCEKCHEIGYKYDIINEIWEIRGGYDTSNKYYGHTIKLKADNNEVRMELLEYIFYVDQCNDKFKDELTALALSGGAIIGMAAGPIGMVIGGSTIVGLLIILDGIGNDMDKCTQYGKIIYNKLESYDRSHQ